MNGTASLHLCLKAGGIGHGDEVEVEEKMPVAEYLSKSGVNLPSGPNLDAEKIEHICNIIVNVLK